VLVSNFLCQVALKQLSRVWEQRHLAAIESGRANRLPEFAHCLEIADFLIKHPECEQAAEALYNMMDVMQDKQMR
jgi:hypothetical protein